MESGRGPLLQKPEDSEESGRFVFRDCFDECRQRIFRTRAARPTRTWWRGFIWKFI
jgi:hypothetical protein